MGVRVASVKFRDLFVTLYMSEHTALHNGDVSSQPSSLDVRKDGGELANFLRPTEAGPKPSFSDVVRAIQAQNILPIAYVAENELPIRPLTAFFTPRYSVPS